jgi:hypothetical protein
MTILPTNLEEAFAALDSLLTPEDRQYLEQHPDEAPVRLHHSLGRHLRNAWGFWSGSPLKTHLQEAHGIRHPDDMSHFVLTQYARCRYPTRYDRIRGERQYGFVLDDEAEFR